MVLNAKINYFLQYSKKFHKKNFYNSIFSLSFHDYIPTPSSSDNNPTNYQRMKL